ncbi:MAG: hypothetical protein RR387_08280 [Clostridiales bacterium]
MNKRKIIAALLAVLMVFVVAGCAQNTDENPPTDPGVTDDGTTTTGDATVTDATQLDITASIKDLEEKKAAPAEFINLAKDKAATASPEEVTALMQSIFNAQKNYVATIATAYEEANANPEFSEIYALDITPELADKITDDTLKTLVTDTYANGLVLQKAEGYVYPVIDIKVYQDNLLTYLPEADATAFEAEINTFNTSL